MLRVFYTLPFIIAFAVGVLAVHFWTGAVEAQQTSSLRMAPLPVEEVPHIQIAQAPTRPAPAAPPAEQSGIAVSVDDDAQNAAPAMPLALDQPVEEPQPAYDRGALDALSEQAAHETAAPTPAKPAQPTPAISRRTVLLEKMIGQMLIFGFQGSSPNQKWPQTVARQLADGTIGGVIFLRYNLSGKARSRRLMRYFHEQTAKAKHPALFMLDQEGGRVQRLGDNVGVKKWNRAATIGRGSTKRAYAQYSQMAAVVQDWGFNVNLGPVVDVNINPANPIIARKGRSYSADPNKVTAFSRAFIEAHRARGVLTALKHFPGHGSSRKDSHLGFTDISRTWREREELAPYRNLFAGGYDELVMTGHLYLDKYAKRGEAKYPATLSRTITTGLLRDKLGFKGVVISDDMEMGSIRKHFGTYDAAILAIKAGVDLLIVSNTAKPRRNLPESYVAAIAKAARGDKVLRQRIEQSYRRIVKLKKRLPRRPGAS